MPQESPSLGLKALDEVCKMPSTLRSSLKKQGLQWEEGGKKASLPLKHSWDRGDLKHPKMDLCWNQDNCPAWAPDKKREFQRNLGNEDVKQSPKMYDLRKTEEPGQREAWTAARPHSCRCKNLNPNPLAKDSLSVPSSALAPRTWLKKWLMPGQNQSYINLRTLRTNSNYSYSTKPRVWNVFS